MPKPHIRPVKNVAILKENSEYHKIHLIRVQQG